MSPKCPQYQFSLEEQKKRFPYFSDEAYKNLEYLRLCICSICMNEQHSNKCKYDRKRIYY